LKPRILFLIPARKGSKGLPQKNIMSFGGSTLIERAVNQAKSCAKVNDVICVSTNDDVAIEIVKKMGIDIPFKRPARLAADETSMEDVIRHALQFYTNFGEQFDCVVLLQPTSPLRDIKEIKSVINRFDGSQEMIVTVNKSKENPYFNLFEETKDGKLIKSKSSDYKTRQEVPRCFVLNGAVYLISTTTLNQKSISDIKFLDKVEMPLERSIDIDTKSDWDLALYYLKKLNENN
jgi:CMP-N,N'-diacetyllegionaminic acid synthase